MDWPAHLGCAQSKTGHRQLQCDCRAVHCHSHMAVSQKLDSQMATSRGTVQMYVDSPGESGVSAVPCEHVGTSHLWAGRTA